MRKPNRKNRAEPWFGLEEDILKSEALGTPEIVFPSELRSEATACALSPRPSS
ncbi:TPA: hypothetical protein HA251_02485 [Candidatus Woesearchaeota archaeon]|nr:hypothetical protein [Candidatus Woesearchaeota archaeon]